MPDQGAPGGAPPLPNTCPRHLAPPRSAAQIASIAAVSAANSTLTFGAGMTQGAEGDATGEDWFVENVRPPQDGRRAAVHGWHALGAPPTLPARQLFEELDAPNEFYLDLPNKKL